MTLPRRDPYLWIHLAGLATVPLWLDLCLSGLAVGDPVVPPWLELTTLGWVGTVPVLWMQLQRPFYIFSIPGLAVRPDKLGEDRRRLLTLQRSWSSRGLVVGSAIALFFILYWLYQLAPIAADTTPFATKSRAVGWLICAIAFLFANLFTQVPATVIPLLLASPQRRDKARPYDPAAILKHFMVIGIRVPAILPDLEHSPDAAMISVAPSSANSSSPVSSTTAESTPAHVKTDTKAAASPTPPPHLSSTDLDEGTVATAAAQSQHEAPLEDTEITSETAAEDSEMDSPEDNWEPAADNEQADNHQYPPESTTLATASTVAVVAENGSMEAEQGVEMVPSASLEPDSMPAQAPEPDSSLSTPLTQPAAASTDTDWKHSTPMTEAPTDSAILENSQLDHAIETIDTVESLADITVEPVEQGQPPESTTDESTTDTEATPSTNPHHSQL